MQEMQVPSLGQEDPLEEEMTTHFSILAWKIPWTGKLGRPQSVGSQRVGHKHAHCVFLVSVPCRAVGYFRAGTVSCC